jgi:hypothetical protein
MPTTSFHSLVSVARFACAFVLCLLTAGTAHAQIRAEFLGTWVPAAGPCTAAARVQFEAARLTLINGADKESFTNVEMAGPGFFPPDYNGIMAVALVDNAGDGPVSVTFNVQEKKGTAVVEFAFVMTGNVNPASAAMNARLAKLNLAKRFPLHNVPLKMCP